MPTVTAGKTRLLAGFFIQLLINGCATLPSQPIPNSLPSQVVLAQTPFFPQQDHQCGPAALATVLGFRQVDVTPDVLTPQVFLPERKGSLQIEIAATARRYGMLVYPLEPELQYLLRELAAGNPVLVLQNLAFDWWPRWHYAVVIGYDLERNELLLRSGRHRRWLSKLPLFQRTWGRAENWALVILPPDRIPATARPAAYLQAAYNLEETGKRQQAQQAYRAAREQWPKEKKTWLALGNNALGLGDHGEAHSAFTRALSLDPVDPVIWNNLAYVYLAAGCIQQARQAIAQALTLQPDDLNLLDSQRDIEIKSQRQTENSCAIPLDPVR